jgi:hypothetical protein
VGENGYWPLKAGALGESRGCNLRELQDGYMRGDLVPLRLLIASHARRRIGFVPATGRGGAPPASGRGRARRPRGFDRSCAHGVQYCRRNLTRDSVGRTSASGTSLKKLTVSLKSALLRSADSARGASYFAFVPLAVLCGLMQG